MAKIILTLLTIATMSYSAMAAPPEVALSDYAFDFTTVGYEISVTGQSSYFSDQLDAGDSIALRDGGYTIKTVIDGLSRKNKKEFINYYNKNCKKSFMGSACHMKITGEVALDDTMKMFLTADEIKVCNKDCSEVLAVFN